MTTSLEPLSFAPRATKSQLGFSIQFTYLPVLLAESRVHSVSESAVFDESDTTALSPREQRALRRKEKSRLAAKLRRNQESNILSCLLQALPVSLTDPSANSDGNSTSKSPSGLNLEKSGVIRMAGQTLFLYNSLSRGTLDTI
ncbi:unnamed protein product [Rodentolepis nana]|uniref:BHLH domain-containing protein n=1 Tax=Rodentolepis nana TaxID=102285 RepID=A0A0R3TG14_RODNA|nr:unnamed protein product [Rodentolepis nana]